MKGRFLVFAAIAIALSAGAIAWAASSTVQSLPFSSGLGSVAACDHAPHWSYAFSKDADGRVSDAHITGIAVACLGGSMQLTLAGPIVTATALPVTITACAATCSVTVPFSSGPLPSQVNTANAVIVGP